jgi:hypothetical protein
MIRHTDMNIILKGHIEFPIYDSIKAYIYNKMYEDSRPEEEEDIPYDTMEDDRSIEFPCLALSFAAFFLIVIWFKQL